MSTLTNPIKQRLSEPGTLFGLWLSLGSADAAEALAHAGFDWLCIDMEHSPNDSADVVAQLRAIAAAHLPSEPVVRVPTNDSVPAPVGCPVQAKVCAAEVEFWYEGKCRVRLEEHRTPMQMV